MKILIHSNSGDSAGLAWIMKNEGAQVSMYIKDPFSRTVMDGIIPKFSLIEGLREKPDVVLFDLNGNGETADKIRADGYKVVGGSKLADKLEYDRDYGANVAKQFGIKIPPTVEFKTSDEAISYVKKTKKPLAIKMDGKDVPEASSYVSKSQEDMLDYISYQKEEGNLKGDAFILQEVIRGQEVSTEGWFSNGIPCFPFNSTWETKKLLAGELGVRTGCETSVVSHYSGTSSKLADKTILRIEPLLKHAKWTGAIDINCIVSAEDHEPYFLEWTPRLGYSAIYAYAAILGIPLSEYFLKIANGSFTIPFKAQWGTSLKIHIPPYPFSHEDDRVSQAAYNVTEGIKINGKYSNDFIPIDVKKGKRTELEAAGTMGIIGECIGRGGTLIKAWKQSKETFDKVEVPNKGGRYTDGIDDAWKRIMKLRGWGYDIANPTADNSPVSRKTTTPYLTAKQGT